MESCCQACLDSYFPLSFLAMRIYGRILGMALVTFAIRYVLFASAGKAHFFPWVVLGAGMGAFWFWRWFSELLFR